MARNNVLDRQRKHVIERNNPVFHVAIIHRRTGVGEKEITCGYGVFVRKVNHQITLSMCGAGMVNLNFVPT